MKTIPGKNLQKMSACVLALLLLVSCQSQSKVIPKSENHENKSEAAVSTEQTKVSAEEYFPASEYSEFDLNDDISEDAVKINFTGKAAEFESESVSLNNVAFVIYDAGDYVLTGEFTGQVIVNAGSDDNVRIILSDFKVSSDMAPIYIVNAKNAVITLAEGSNNTVSDSKNYSFAEDADEPDAAIFSKCDLTINGTGYLEVNGNYACGIRSKDELKIVSGNISVTAEKDGIKGRDSVVVRNGNITVLAGEDGIQSNNDEDADRGYIIFEGGYVEVSAGDDGIRAENWLQIYDGEVTVKNSYEGLESKKIEIYGGNVDVKASDDGINASSGTSSGGEMFGKTDMNMDFGGFGGNKGERFPENGNIPDMSEGGGFPERTDRPFPSDMPWGSGFPDMQGDQNNANMPVPEMNRGGGFDGSREDTRGGFDNRGDMNFGDFGKGMFNETPEEGVYILIAGGNVRVEAGVDIIDSNGTFTQTGGTLITSGRSMSVYGSPEGVVDCNGAAVSEGGTFISLARSLGNNSSAYNKLNGFCLYENSNSNFDEVIRITCSDGVEIISFVPKTSCSMILITSELFESGKEYKIEFGSDVYEYNCTDGIVNIR